MNQTSSSKGLPGWAIALIVLGVLAAIVIIVLIILCIRYLRKEKHVQDVDLEKSNIKGMGVLKVRYESKKNLRNWFEIIFFKLDHNSVQYSIIQCSAAHRTIPQLNAMLRKATHNAVQCNATQCNATHYKRTNHNKTQQITNLIFESSDD